MIKRLLIIFNLAVLVVLMNTDFKFGDTYTYNNVEVKPNIIVTTREDEVRSCYIDMSCIQQYPELPTGCEAISLTNVLNYYGFGLDKYFIVNNYLLYYSDDYQIGYRGSPWSIEGATTFPKCIADTANNFLRDQNSNLTAYEITGTDFYALLEFIKRGIPVMIWVTGSYTWPEFSGEYYSFGDYGYWNYWDEHCVVLNGFDLDNNLAYIADPMEGEKSMNLEWTRALYEGCGSMAVVIY